MTTTDSIRCVVLAAGFSRRFGTNKLASPLQGGPTVLAKTLSIYLTVFDQVYVVIQPDCPELLSISRGIDRVSIIENPDADLGLSQSIIKAVNHTQRSQADFNGWLFALADMPFIRTETVLAVCEQAGSNAIVQPYHNGRGGNPVYIGKGYADELLTLSGDVGAKPLLNLYADRIVNVECQDPGIVMDIDRPTDLPR